MKKIDNKNYKRSSPGMHKTLVDRQYLQNYRRQLSQVEASFDVAAYAKPIYRRLDRRIKKNRSLQSLRRLEQMPLATSGSKLFSAFSSIARILLAIPSHFLAARKVGHASL